MVGIGSGGSEQPLLYNGRANHHIDIGGNTAKTVTKDKTEKTDNRLIKLMPILDMTLKACFWSLGFSVCPLVSSVQWSSMVLAGGPVTGLYLRTPYRAPRWPSEPMMK